MITALTGQANIVELPIVAKASGNPITSGTVNFYLLDKDGPNAGKWYRGSDTSWQVAESIAGEATHRADGHWYLSLPEAVWDRDVRYRLYAKEDGDLHIPVGDDILGSVPDFTSVAYGLCQAGSTDYYAVLAASEPATDDLYNGCLLTIVKGTGFGQARMITDYIGASKIAGVNRPFTVVPDNTSTYRVYPYSGILMVDTGKVSAATSSSLTLADSASATANCYIGHTVFICGGPGIGQARIITSYTAERVASISPNWTVNPTSSSVYMILPIARSYVDEISASAATAIVDAFMADTGFTAGGSMTYAEYLKITAAWAAGNWRIKSGETSIYELLDADDGATVILELTVSTSTPFKSVTIL